jgi:hypothetical protein
VYVGFTGSRRGLTPAQCATLRRVLASPRLRILRVTHGDAPGADAELHDLAVELDLDIVLRPSDHPERAGRTTGRIVERHDPKPPLERNANIAAAGAMLIACPHGPEERRSGTWSTVRRARALAAERAIDVLIVWPDGTTKGERYPVPQAKHRV